MIGGSRLLRRLQRRSLEDGEPAEGSLLVVRKEVIRPPDRGSERSLPRIGVASPFDVEQLWKPVEHLPRRQDLRAGGRKLDRQGQRIEACAELGDVVRGLAPRTHAEELDRLGGSEWRHLQLEFALHAQRLSGRDQERQVRTRGQQPGQLDRRFRDVLEVVEHDQHLPDADLGGELPARPDRLRDRLAETPGLVHVCEIDPEDAAGVARHRGACCCEGQPRLAGAARPRHAE